MAGYSERDRNPNRRLKVLVTEAERAQITSQAERAGLSVSDFLRRLALGAKIDSRFDYVAINEIMKTRGDMGRLGGLLKLHIHSHRDDPALAAVLNEVLELKAKLDRLVASL